MTEERLQKLMARAGVASRRAAEQLIRDGQVRVNGVVVTELGARAHPTRDRIEVSGRSISREELVHFLVHKPRGMVTTLQDPEGRPTLAELLTDIGLRVYPVGRLDFHTSGALLVTNDGDLAQALLHPSRGVPKTYVAKLSAEAEPRLLNALREGVTLDDGYRTAPAEVHALRVEEGKTWVEITISEGKNRQIHRMVEAVGLRVMRLSRLSFAGLSTDGLRPGQSRPLTESEVAALRREYQGLSTAPRAMAPRADTGPVSTSPGPRDERLRTSSTERPRDRMGAGRAPAADARTSVRGERGPGSARTEKGQASFDSPPPSSHKRPHK